MNIKLFRTAKRACILLSPRQISRSDLLCISNLTVSRREEEGQTQSVLQFSACHTLSVRVCCFMICPRFVQGDQMIWPYLSYFCCFVIQTLVTLCPRSPPFLRSATKRTAPTKLLHRTHVCSIFCVYSYR